MATRKKPENFNFEKSLEQLNLIVEKMEKGDLPLEQSLKSFEEGIKIIHDCQNALTTAEQKVDILLKQQGKEKLEPYQNNE